MIYRLTSRFSNCSHGIITHAFVLCKTKFIWDRCYRYAAKALSRLNLDNNISDEQLERARERIQHCGEVVAFYTLRLSLAPVIEKLILLDRICFLAEQGNDLLFFCEIACSVCMLLVLCQHDFTYQFTTTRRKTCSGTIRPE